MKKEIVIRVLVDDNKDKLGIVKQVIPSDQINIILRALDLLKSSIELSPYCIKNECMNYDHFDILTLKGMLQGEVSVEHPKAMVDAFSFNYEGVDFPCYGEKYPLIEL